MTRVGLIVLCLPALAQQPVCQLTGTVLDYDSHKPIARARVFATGGSYSLWRTTDNSGAFCFEQLEPQSYRLWVQKTGYIEDERRVNINAEQKLPPILRFSLTAQAVISGVVLDGDGEPLPRATVTLWTAKHSGKGAVPKTEETTVSDTGGAFRFSGLLPGTFYVSAGATPGIEERGFAMPLLDNHGQVASDVSLPTYYADARTFAGATPITVGAGDQIGNLLLTVKSIAGRRLAGRTEAPQSQSWLVLDIPSEDSAQRVVPVQPDGTFSASGLRPAVYVLVLRDGDRTIAKQTVDLADGDATGVTLDPLQTIDVQMKLVTEHKGPPYILPPDARIFLTRPDTDGNFGIFQSDGTVLFRDVEPALYSYDIPLGEQRLFVKQVKFAGEVQKNNTIDLRSAQAGGVIEVLLSPNVARLEGSVEAPKSQPADDADENEEISVILVPARPVAGEIPIVKQVTPDEKGNFKLEALAPGKYRLFAIQGFDEDDWGSPELATALASKGVAVELKENESKSVRLRVISSDEWDAAVAKVGG